jgi:hypothetical protein
MDLVLPDFGADVPPPSKRDKKSSVKNIFSSVPHLIGEAKKHVRFNRLRRAASLPISETVVEVSKDVVGSVSLPAGSMVKALDPALFPPSVYTGAEKRVLAW